jgi:hypothetical protein
MTRFWKTALCVAAGGTTAAFMAPVIAGWGGTLLVTHVASGVLGSTVSTVANNMASDEPDNVQYHPRETQLLFRNAVSNLLNQELDPILRSIQRNQEGDFRMTFIV